MIPKQVNRLYDGLTPREQANMVFAAGARRDNAEADVILSRVERVACKVPHLDYIQRILASQALMFAYGIEYWRVRALMFSVSKETDAEAKNAAKRLFQQVKALESALTDVCERFNVDITAIKTMAQCPDNEPLSTAEADADLVSQYTEFLTVSAFGVQ
ncbi:hypothetical protein [Methylomicrobium sp. Wu6]|uniref:hypothetical protein n=1 Tax=Methylomicrobium sp. Wu6 TaxID=3107928 RepID=UPI002DD61BED|nr:hypothetical protein [Methylomicrobium sp. Wu6]MEC4749080.1 hypothetical protein [Methylomicrobium sp. Wu6]